MSPERCDIVVVGGGPAGQKAAIQGAKAGRRVLLVDEQANLGGECVQRGTIPSKTLRQSALAISGLRRRTAGVFDLPAVGGLEVECLMRRLDAVRDNEGVVVRNQLERNGIACVTGRARFLSAHELELRTPNGTSRRISGDVIVLATGSRPRRPPDVPVDHERILDSDSILSLIYLPETLAVLGAGVIACEFASIFAALGVQVTLIDRAERPMGFMDPEITDHFQRQFEHTGGVFLAGRRAAKVEWDGVSRVVTTLDDGQTVRSEKMLCAQGRTARVQGLDIERAGLETSERGFFVVDEYCRTSVPHIYAVGDVIGPPALAASSMEQGRRAARHACGLEVDGAQAAVPIGIYTIPEMSSVGLNESEVVERHGSALVGRAVFAEISRGMINGDTEGLLKLVSDPRGEEILGCQIVGEGAAELIHVAQMAMLGGCGIDTLVDNIFNYPTLAEGYRIAALDVAGQRARVRRKAG